MPSAPESDAELPRDERKYSLIGMVRRRMHLRRFSARTEEAYVGWIKRFARFHQLRHPRSLGEAEVTAYLTHLAVRERVSASTQNQALAALLFLSRDVFREPLPWLNEVVRARRPERLPSVLTREEVRLVPGGGARPRPVGGAPSLRCRDRRTPWCTRAQASRGGARLGVAVGLSSDATKLR